ncbi:flavin reductase [Christensenellaceae bacterium NSJ-44]|uniref:Flavin reductase n=1 Tax=Luoshenia tenuis TaxID=2763654 RepID=A0A926D0Q7_9FIRM|nr:flavin reductase family protein [Luoshenia tenuis]MBC8529404.1 flavin reductase [Luoshenia tenuis]
MDSAVLWQLSYGMYAIGVSDNGRPCGCIVNTVTQVTAENPVIALNVNKQNYTYDVMMRTGAFSVSILTEQARPEAIGALGFASGRDQDKFQNLDYALTADGLPILKEGTCGFITCKVISTMEMETHVVVLARVQDAFKGADGVPMTYRYYHEVVKGRAPKNAPTYQAQSEEVSQPEQGPGKYVCDRCGYTFEGDFSQTLADFTCPLCGASRGHFKKQG